MTNTQELLNKLLVQLFNDILHIEENSLKNIDLIDLSMTEIHTIEAIGIKDAKTMGEIAHDLRITVGTLTTAITKLIKKGYVERKRIEEDRRVVLIRLTHKGEKAFDSHAQFHTDMIKSIIQELPETEETVLITALKRMTNFFEEKYNLLG